MVSINPLIFLIYIEIEVSADELREVEDEEHPNVDPEDVWDDYGLDDLNESINNGEHDINLDLQRLQFKVFQRRLPNLTEMPTLD